MSTLLYVESSPRKQRSASIAVARAFLEAYRAAHPTDTIDTLDVWSTPLPEFDGAVLSAKYAGIAGTELSVHEAHAWADIRALAARFTRADKYLFSVPMWNYSIPYKLKHLIDCFTLYGGLASALTQGTSMKPSAMLLPGGRAPPNRSQIDCPSSGTAASRKIT